MQAFVNKLIVYPIKSLDGIELPEVELTEYGNLKMDRQFAFKTEEDAFVNAKRFPEILKIRASYDLENSQLSLKDENDSERFDLHLENQMLNEFISDKLGKKIKLHENLKGGFPDDTKRQGPTVCSTQSFKILSEWFPHLTLESLRRRFRANIELNAESSDAFWEDELLFNGKSEISFKNSQIKLVKPCPRCPVPSRDPETAERDNSFQLKFEEFRKSYRQYDQRELYPHYYLYAINTTVLKSGAIEKGEALEI